MEAMVQDGDTLSSAKCWNFNSGGKLVEEIVVGHRLGSNACFLVAVGGWLSSRDTAGSLDESMENAVPAQSGLLDIRGLERAADALSGSIFGGDGEVDPPGTVVVPEMVVGIVAGDTDCKMV